MSLTIEGDEIYLKILEILKSEDTVFGLPTSRISRKLEESNHSIGGRLRYLTKEGLAIKRNTSKRMKYRISPNGLRLLDSLTESERREDREMVRVDDKE